MLTRLRGTVVEHTARRMVGASQPRHDWLCTVLGCTPAPAGRRRYPRCRYCRRTVMPRHPTR